MWVTQKCSRSFFLLALLALTGPLAVESRIDEPKGEELTDFVPAYAQRDWQNAKQAATVHELHTGLLQKEDQTPTATTKDESHKSWFERVGEAFASVLVGLFVVIPFSVALLWLNEKRNAQLESLIGLAKGDAKEVSTTDTNLGAFSGTLVHLSGDEVKGLDLVEDDRFKNVRYKSGCIKLRSVMEVLQWVEQEHHEKKKDAVGGGETTVTTYSYHKKWVTEMIDSTAFKDKTKFAAEGGSQNCINAVGVKNSNLGIREKVNPKVKYGEPYQLKENLTKHLSNYVNAQKDFGDALEFGTNSFQFTGKHYQCPPRKKNCKEEIGDVRVMIECVKDGPATILALQEDDGENHADGCYTFGPYRLVSRGCCIRDEELKKRRLAAAEMDEDALYEQDRWKVGPFRCLCYYCNLVTWGFTRLSGSAAVTLTPQIYSIWAKQMSKTECLDYVKMDATAKKWIIRLVGWLLLWAGFTMLFAPLEVFADIIPYVGPYLGTGIMWVVGFLTFLLTVALSTLIVACAYLIYHPLKGMMYAAITALVYACIFGMGQLIKAKEG